MNKKISILYVEDDLLDQMAFKRYVQTGDFEYDYFIASTVGEAIQIFEKESIDVIISDYILGIDTALDLMGEIPGMPFIVVTGAGDQLRAVKAMKAGAYDYLIKDSSGNHLHTIQLTVEKALKRRADEQELILYRENLENLVKDRTKALEKEIEVRRKRELELKYQNDEIAALNEELIATNDAIKISNNELIKTLQRAEEADKLKNAFLANLSHEIRTPLNSIMGFSNLLESEDTDKEEMQSYISLIRSSSDQLLSIISDIIDISKIEVGQLKIKYNRFYINLLLNDLKVLFQSEKQIKHKTDIDIYVDTPLPDNESEIISDRVRLQQIMTNLLSNSLKFTDSGSIKFGYKIKDQKIHFFVEDTGIGIPIEMQEHIFKRFRQADGSHSRKYGGTGLGLAISKGLIELLGGKIWVNSIPGTGSTFHFIVPYEKPREDLEKSNDSLDDNFSWFGKTVLIVEDVYNNYKFLYEVLKRTGIHILHAENGRKAIDMCKRNKEIDVVLMDIQLPEMTGYEVVQEILKIRKGLPIIAQTAHAFEYDREESLKAGCSDYISKPIAKEELIKKLQRFISI